MAGLPEILSAIVSGRGLSFDDAKALAGLMLEGGFGDVEAAAVLAAMSARGFSGGEVAGFAAGLRERCIRVNAPSNTIDTAGTGGDGSHTLNVSTAAALVAAAAGAIVAKHGNRSVSSKSGSADFLEALGYTIDHGREEAECMLDRAGFTFLYAPRYHPAMRRVMPVRRRLGIRTVFNLVGPLSNPAMVERQVLGVASRGLLDVMAEAAVILGYRHALLVHGHPGIDEVSVSGPTWIYEVRGGSVGHYAIGPEDLGVGRHSLVELRVEGVSESVERFRRLIAGKGRRGDEDFVVANSALALYVAGVVSDFRDGAELARQLIREGEVARKLREVIEACRKCCGR